MHEPRSGQEGKSNAAKVGDKNIAPTTTAAEDETKQGQRRVNLIWESTQAIIAVAVTGAVIYAALNGRESVILGNAFTLIIAIYFVRMNHTKIGGIREDEQTR